MKRILLIPSIREKIRLFGKITLRGILNQNGYEQCKCCYTQCTRCSKCKVYGGKSSYKIIVGR